MFVWLFFLSIFGVRGSTPVSECPDASVLHYEWGRFLMYDMTDNGLLDASILYGLTAEITNELLVGGLPPYLALSASGYLPRLCNTSIIEKLGGCSSDNLPCCGDPRCAESAEMQTIFTLLVREHNAFITKVTKGAAGHDPHLFTLARNHIISLLGQTCPGCRPPTAVCSASVASDLLRLLSFAVNDGNTLPSACSGAISGVGVIICDDNITLTFETPITQIMPPNSTLPSESLNFSYYLDITHTQLELSLNPSVDTFWESYFGVDGNATSLLVALLSERHGPSEEDIIGRLGHALFIECFGIPNPLWINTASIRTIISQFYTSTCPVQCTLDSSILAQPSSSSSSDPSSSNGSNHKVQEGSLIFFVVMLGVLTVALFVVVMYKLFT
jgi:hypothetical protein